MTSLATTVSNSNGAPDPFLVEARALIHGNESVVLTTLYLGHYFVLDSVGRGFRVDEDLGSHLSASTHAGGAKIDVGPVVDAGAHTTLNFAVGPPLVPTDRAVFLKITTDPFAVTPLSASPVARDLHLAVYGSDRPARDNLVTTTGSDLAPGAQVRESVTVGNAVWTLVAVPKGPLLGRFATIAPYVILGLGLSFALALSAVIEGRIRRRRARVGPGTSFEAAPSPPPRERQPIVTAPAPAISTDLNHLVDRDPVPAPVTSPTPAVVPLESAPDQGPLDAPSGHGDWRRDPFGRFEQRRFFLGRPTSLVRSGTSERYDPVTPGMGASSQSLHPRFDQAQRNGDVGGDASKPGGQPEAGGAHVLHPSIRPDDSLDRSALPHSAGQQHAEALTASVIETLGEELAVLRAAARELSDSVRTLDSPPSRSRAESAPPPPPPPPPAFSTHRGATSGQSSPEPVVTPEPPRPSADQIHDEYDAGAIAVPAVDGVVGVVSSVWRFLSRGQDRE